MDKFYKILLAVISVALFAGCRSGRTSVAPSVLPDASVQQQASGSNGGMQSCYDALAGSYGVWSDVEMSVKLQLKSPANFSVSAKAAMKRGEWISISVRMLGLEVATLWADNDSVHAVDKYHKKFVSESIDRLLGNRSITLADLQDLIMGRAFLAGVGTVTSAMAADFVFEEESGDMMFYPRKQGDGFSYGFLAGGNGIPFLRATSVEIGDRYAGLVTYATPIQAGRYGTFAKTVSVDTMSGRKLSVSVDWDLNGAKWDSGIRRSWRRPSGYTRIAASDLLKSLANF